MTEKKQVKTTVYTELNRIQQELKAPKNLFNSFGKYNYRNYESIAEAVKPILGESVLITSDDIVLVGERYYIKATVSLIYLGEKLEASGFAREAEIKKGMDLAQVTGSCSSYARKYAINGLFQLDDTKDADTDEYTKQAKKPAGRKKVAPPLEAIEPENTKATKDEILDKINNSKAKPHLTNIYNKYSDQAKTEGWQDELVANCSRVKAGIEMRLK